MNRTIAIIIALITGVILLILVTNGDWLFIIWMAIWAVVIKLFVIDASNSK